MLFWLTLIVTVVGFGIFAFGEWCDECIDYKEAEKSKLRHWLYMNYSEIESVGCIVCGIGFIVLVIMIVFLLGGHIGCGAEVAEMNEQYKGITYKVESGACRDELGLLSKEVIDEVQEWNEDIVYYQNVQDDFWIGIFVPNIYDQFETIGYERYR